MTLPRQILPGTSYLITRRCSERRFFLRPSAACSAIFRYLLATAAERHGILLHAFCVMSNHYHLVVTDPEARLPDFQRDLDGLVARAMNRALGRRESFWDPDSYNDVRLETSEAVLEKMAYVLANPVNAGLVRRGREWPGLWSSPASIGGPAEEVERPVGYFRKKGPLPAKSKLKLHLPPGVEDQASLSKVLYQAIEGAERRAQAKVARERRTILGPERVRDQDPMSRPKTTAPKKQLAPRVATRDPLRRVEALQRLVGFRQAHRIAFAAWRRGVRDTEFPPGTWLMRVRHGARCARS